eukprot:3728717-Pleurochrysis_carterae.AAC.2
MHKKNARHGKRATIPITHCLPKYQVVCSLEHRANNLPSDVCTQGDTNFLLVIKAHANIPGSAVQTEFPADKFQRENVWRLYLARR